MNHSPNTKQIVHVPVKKYRWQKKASQDANTKTIHTFSKWNIYLQFFGRKYWRATIIWFDTGKGYYTVQYDKNDEEELTPEEVEAYLIPPEKGEYWTENQSDQQISK